LVLGDGTDQPRNDGFVNPGTILDPAVPVGFASANGTIIYDDSASTVSVVFHSFGQVVGGTSSARCEFFGTATES